MVPKMWNKLVIPLTRKMTESIPLHHPPVRLMSTIYALSSGHGKCGVSLIRVSGPAAMASLQALTLQNEVEVHKPRKATLNKIVSPKCGTMIDHALTIWFPGPNSFTGEDSVEFQVHGGTAVVSAVLNALAEVPGCRPAKPGEYVRRAFANGKLDLTQVEGLADLINAETEQQRRQAFRQMDGDLYKIYSDWSSRLTHLLAKIEAFVDFGDSGDVEDSAVDDVTTGVKALLEEVSGNLQDARSGQLLRSGVRTAIVGNPNVGKSSILNLLVQRPAALVSPVAGTTRDVIETFLNIGGFPIVLTDTAGNREVDSSVDPVEVAGIHRARETTQGADMVIAVCEARELTSVDDVGGHFQALVSRCGGADVHEKILVVNKSDLLSQEEHRELQIKLDALDCLLVSCQTNQDIPNLVKRIGSKLEGICRNSGAPAPTRERHKFHLTNVAQHLTRFVDSVDDEVEWVMRAHHLTLAYKELGLILGKGSMTDVHDAIFSDFCIGK